MNSQNDKEGSGHVKAAYITGIFVVTAACIAGAFAVLNTMVDNGIIVIGMSNPSLPETAIVISPTLEISTDTQDLSITQLPTILLPSPTPLSPPTLPEGYISLEKYYSYKENSKGKVGDQIYSHFISGKIKYTRISADDDIDKIELVCTDSISDITEMFFDIPKPEGDKFPNYASETINIPSNCRIDFHVVDTIGLGTGITVYAEPVP